jgi:beta-glucanase (GH16 family)
MNCCLRFSRRNFASIFALVVLGYAFSGTAAAQCGTTPATGAITWTTNWCDEFNGAANSPISSANWTYDTVRLVGSTYTSARLKTQGLQSFHSGRIEASIQMPSHAGLWPAFWNLGSQPRVSWPTVGESDVMENWPTTSNIPGPGATGNRSTIHTKITGGSGFGGAFTFPSGERVDTAFHVYGEIWSANMIQFYVDDPTQPFFVATAADLPSGDVWPFSSSADPFFLITNVAVGGTLGAPTDSLTGSQPPMLLDYVRQYLPSSVPAPLLTAGGNITVKAGATSGNTTSLQVMGTTGIGRVAFSCTTTAPKASCVVTSSDALNRHTVDFSNSSSANATVTVTTAANTHGGRTGGTTPGTYTVTVNAFTESSSDATQPSAGTSFSLTVN